MSERYDAIVIGTGQSGPALAQRFDREGLRVAVIERKHFGGTCVNTGCIPTKTLVASARVAHMARRAAEYGVDLGSAVTVDMKRVKARKDAVVALSRVGVTDWMEGLKNGRVFRGHARFTGRRTVRVNGEELAADRIFINVGGRAFVPDIRGLDTVPYLTNSTTMEVDALPEHLIVIGGSYIGLEFAQAFRRFGSRVTVVEMADRLIPREDADVSEAVRDILQAEGIAVRTGTKCLSVSERDGRIALGGAGDGGKPQVEGSHLLLAVGRRPNTDDLGLDTAGVEVDDNGFVTVDDQCRTSVDGIWAIGDVNGRGAFTHTSYNDHEIVAANIFDDDNRRISDRVPCYGLFIDPPLGRVGLTEREVRERGIKALAAKRMMTTVGRARERGETQGFMKVVVDAGTKEVLGAAILGVNGDEAVQVFLTAMAERLPATSIARTMHIHPTVSEYLPTLIGDLKPLC
ncbi:putative pyridine nucleotide-disulfide oxidoreductase RclA [Defluviimonas aquaemixtae]|uniref:Putative pyridine nucleotide-disulfide oxidoreductase RclA n=1 Tax=Albidovulum aquaemixtae TaxID=1542388 RepID=A0A2R8B4L0_9RHOB|nr:FAD-containing oxidoreductase [Defluviimonas aquaemixtae]SPH17512.1 putative pyridine nucleotide-disulfide oxidoreductase RclA [Defluviimonas aquaemixtae]